MAEYIFNFIIGIILLILVIILYLAILEIRDDTKRTNKLLHILLKWQIEHDKNAWENYKEQEWKKSLATLPIIVKQEKILEKERKDGENE